MPRDITHVIIADEAAKIIKNEEIFANFDAFHMGTVADDSFLYTASPLLSTRLHGGLKDDTRAVVLEMMDNLKKEKNPARRAEKTAFVYGYLSHMAVDATFHPLIYSISGSHFEANSKKEVELSKACHRYAETWLDLHFMRDKKKSFKNFRPFRKIISKMAMRVRLDDFFTDCLQAALKAKKYTWGDNFDLQAQFHNGMTRQLFVDKITQNQTVARVLRKLDRVLHGKLKLYVSGFYDFEGDIPQRLTAGLFVHPVSGEMIKKSIADLEQDAVMCSVKFMQAADDYIKYGNKEAFLEVVPNVNMDTGVENTGREALKNKITQEAFAAMQRGKKQTLEAKEERERVRKAMKENSKQTAKTVKRGNTTAINSKKDLNRTKSDERR